MSESTADFETFVADLDFNVFFLCSINPYRRSVLKPIPMSQLLKS